MRTLSAGVLSAAICIMLMGLHFSDLIGGILVPLRSFADGTKVRKSYEIQNKNAFGASRVTGIVTCSFQLTPPVPGFERTFIDMCVSSLTVRSQLQLLPNRLLLPNPPLSQPPSQLLLPLQQPPLLHLLVAHSLEVVRFTI
jgi:hypothetical protein